MSIGSIIGGGIHMVRTQPHVVAIWAALYLVAAVAGMVVMRPMMESMLAFQRQAAAAATANAAASVRTPPVFPTDLFGQLFLLELLFLLVLVVAFAAVVRATVRPGGDRFAYLRLGMDELRLVGLGFLFFALAIAAEVVAIVGLGIVGALAGVVLGKAAAIGIVVVLAIALFCAAIWAEVRISLAGAMTVMRGRIVVRDAWRATRGRFWTLFGAYLLLSVAFGIVGLIVTAIMNPQVVAAYASLDQQALNAAAEQQMARQGAGLSAAMLVQLAVGSIVFVVMGAVALGAVATAALELGGPFGTGAVREP